MRRAGLRVLGLCALVAISISAGAGQDAKSQLPEGPGKDTFVRICSNCHGIQMVLGRGNTEDGWTQVVQNMIQRGAQGSDDDFAQVVQYLTTNFPPGAAKINLNKATADELKNGLSLTPKEAAAIVSYREHNGNFKAVEDLKKVQDLDYSKVEAKKDRVIL